jgi:ABC-2 type transport system permease protein
MMQMGFKNVLLPGIIAISMVLSGIQAVAMPLIAEFQFTREIEDRLLAPVSTRLVAVEKVCAGALQGVVSALFVLPVARLIMGPVAGLTLGHGAMVLVVTVLGAVAFSALGLLLGTAISPQQIGLMFSVIVSPMIFFGCTYYPWQALGVLPVLKYLVLLNPLVYVAEGMRAVLTPGVPHMHLGAVTGALGALSAAFLALGLRSFERRAVG